MVKQIINVGTTVNDGTGSTIRAGGQIVNANFSEVYSAIGDGSSISFNVNATGVSANQGLIFNSSSSKFEPANVLTTTLTQSVTNKTFNVTNTFPSLNLIDDSSTAGVVSLGGDLRINTGTGLSSSVSGSTYTINFTGGIAATDIGGGTVDNTEFGHLNGVTSNVQTQINNARTFAIAMGIALG